MTAVLCIYILLNCSLRISTL